MKEQTRGKMSQAFVEAQNCLMSTNKKPMPTESVGMSKRKSDRNETIETKSVDAFRITANKSDFRATQASKTFIEGGQDIQIVEDAY